MKARLLLPLLLLVSGEVMFTQSTSTKEIHSPAFVERASLDWNHAGKPTTFTLTYRHRTDGAGDSDRLVIRRQGSKPWILVNKDDEWTALKTEIPPALLRKNLVSSDRMLFIRSGPAADARTYLILKGGGYGCCVGSLTVITPGQDGTPKVVFHAVEHLLGEILLQPGGDSIALVGQPSDAEARALKNAESYDPYRIYVIEGYHQARFDLEQSKAYSVEHYCEWAGPTYNEKFIAVSVDSDRFGAGHCRAMTETQFNAYRTKHPTQFPEK
jgi:hypothetical protein